MPISAIGTASRAGRQRGFTLIEVLVVLAIIAVAGAAVILALPPPRAEVERAADRLTGVLAEAARHSVIKGRPVAVEIDAAGYQVLEGSRLGWRPSPQFQEVSWPSGVSASVAAEGDYFVAVEHRTLRFEPFGSATPAIISVSDADGDRRRITIDADGRIALKGQ